MLSAVAIALVGGGVFAPAARAAALPQYKYVYTAAATNYSAPAGSTLTISVYLEETATATAPPTTPSLINSDGGLALAAFTVSPFTSSPASSVLSVAANAGVPPIGFDAVVTQSVSGGVGTVSEGTGNVPVVDDNGVFAAPIVGAGFSGVLLGSVTISVGAANSSTTFTLAPGDGSYTNITFYPLDDATDNPTLYDSAASNTFIVTATAAVPEPASLALAAGALVAFARRGRRRA